MNVNQTRDPLSVGVAQPESVPYDVAANAETHAAVIRSVRARLVVFPELSLTGYHLDASPVSPEDDRLEAIVDACRDAGSMALVGAPVAGDYIGMLAIDGHGASVVYRKMWLGEAERERFLPGERAALLELDGWRLGLAICKDTSVSQHASDNADLGMDVYVAGVLEHFHEAEVVSRRARRVAIDHGVWVALASFAGKTGGGFNRGAGGSGIWGPQARLLTTAGSDVGEIVRATVEDGSSVGGRP